MNRSYIIAFWSPSPISHTDLCMDFFSLYFKKFGDIQCLDCKSNQDGRTLRLMRQADLVVIAVHQSHREICDLFLNSRIRFSNCVWLVVDYIPEPGFDLSRISFEFRIPDSRLLCIPYQPAGEKLLQERNRGKYRPFTEQCSGRSNPDYRRELTRSARMMLKALGF